MILKISQISQISVSKKKNYGKVIKNPIKL